MNTKNKTKDKLLKARAIFKKINSDIIDTSFNGIEKTAQKGKKWQDLTAKLVKKAEPVTKKNINMVVETAESIKEQLDNGTERFKTLVGYDQEMVEKAKKKVKKNLLVKTASKIKKKVKKEAANNIIVKKAEKVSDKLKKNISEKIEDVKEKIENYTEDAVKSVYEKQDDIKISKTTVKKKTTKNKEVLEEVDVAEKAEKKDDLKVIKGIGPVLEKSLNKLNITTYSQIATMTIKNMTKLLTDAGINAKIYDLSGWKAQAEFALNGDLEALKNWKRK